MKEPQKGIEPLTAGSSVHIDALPPHSYTTGFGPTITPDSTRTDAETQPEATDERRADMVNHPPHYTADGIECIDAIRAALGRDAFVAYCRGNAIKYLWRASLKGAAEQDARKAVWYATKAADVLAEVTP